MFTDGNSDNISSTDVAIGIVSAILPGVGKVVGAAAKAAAPVARAVRAVAAGPTSEVAGRAFQIVGKVDPGLVGDVVDISHAATELGTGIHDAMETMKEAEEVDPNSVVVPNP